MFRQDVSCPALLEDHNVRVAYGAVTLSRTAFQPFPLLAP